MKPPGLIFFILITFFSYGQTPTQQKIIEGIRKEFQAINKDNTLKVSAFDLDEFIEDAPDGGGEIKGYFKKNNLVKIYVWIGLSNLNKIQEFYFKNNELFFAYEKREYFLQTNDSLDHSKIGSSAETRAYFDKGKMIYLKTLLMPTEGEKLTIANEFKETASFYAKRLKEKVR